MVRHLMSSHPLRPLPRCPPVQYSRVGNFVYCNRALFPLLLSFFPPPRLVDSPFNPPHQATPPSPSVAPNATSTLFPPSPHNDPPFFLPPFFCLRQSAHPTLSNYVDQTPLFVPSFGSSFLLIIRWSFVDPLRTMRGHPLQTSGFFLSPLLLPLDHVVVLFRPVLGKVSPPTLFY